MPSIPHIPFHQRATPNPPGFELVRISDLTDRDHQELNHDPFKPHRLTFNVLLAITEGQAQHFVDFETHSLGAGDCLPIFSQQIQAFDAKKEYDGYLILGTDAFLSKNLHPDIYAFLTQSYRYGWQKKPMGAGKLTEHLISRLKAVAMMPRFKAPEIGAAIGSFYAGLFSAYDPENQVVEASHSRQLFFRFQHLIDQHFTQSRSAKFYAESLDVSYKHLNSICQQTVQRSAKAVIDSAVILEAKRMLVSSPDSIKEIAFAMGFDEPTNFQKYFKKLVGDTPKGFRKRNG